MIAQSQIISILDTNEEKKMTINCKNTFKKTLKNESTFYESILNQSSVSFSFKMQAVNDLIR